MRVNYFDLGFCWDCAEIDKIINDIFPSLGIEDYRIYAFDACREYAESALKKYKDNPKIQIYNYAVSDSDKIIKLYHHWNRTGHSIYNTKQDVSSEYEEVYSIVFSEWFLKNISNPNESFNIMKVNIEGAEWDLFNDMSKNDVIKYFNFFCGDRGIDVTKVGELKDKADEFFQLLEQNNVTLHRFVEGWRPEKNADIKQLIKEKYENFILSK